MFKGTYALEIRREEKGVLSIPFIAERSQWNILNNLNIRDIGEIADRRLSDAKAAILKDLETVACEVVPSRVLSCVVRVYRIENNIAHPICDLDTYTPAYEATGGYVSFHSRGCWMPVQCGRSTWEPRPHNHHNAGMIGFMA